MKAPFALVSALSLFATIESASAQNTVYHYVTVKNAAFQTTWSNTDSDVVFGLANNLVFSDDDGSGSADVMCYSFLYRSGNVDSDYTGAGNVANVSDLDYWYGVSGFVKVVSTITWCGGSGSFNGCTYRGRLNGFVVTEAASRAASNGNTWAHEYGHSVGLLDDNADSTRIMWGTGSASKNRLTAAECTAFMTDSLDGSGPGAPAPESAGELSGNTFAEADALNFEGRTIEEVVEEGFVDLIPVEAADAYGDAELQKLRQMLQELKDPLKQATAAQLLGIISKGGDDDAKALATFLGTNPPANAAASAVLSLGYVAHRRSSLALTLLETLVSEPASPKRVWALQALGLAGTTEALRLLEISRVALLTDHDLRVWATAIADNSAIQARGLKQYYRPQKR